MGMEMVDKTVEGGVWPMTSLDPLTSPDSSIIWENILSDS